MRKSCFAASQENETLLHRIPVSLLMAVPLGLALQTTTPRCVIAQTPPQQASPPAATAVLPANTPGLLLINTATNLWQDLDRFNPLPPQFKVPFQVPFFPTEIDFAADIQPWLGDRVGLALLPATSETETLESSALVLAPIKDANRFNTFLAKLKTAKGQPEIERDYKGVTILQWSVANSSIKEPASPEAPDQPSETPTPEPTVSPSPQSRLPLNVQPSQLTKAVKPKPSPAPQIEESEPLPTSPLPDLTPPKRNLVIAVLPGNLAIATQAQALEKLIDAQTNLTPLSQNPQFLRTLRHPQSGRSLVIGYGDTAGAAKLLKPFAAKASPFPLPLPIPTLNSSSLEVLAQTYSAADTHIWLQPEGIHSQTNFYYTTPRPELATANTANANQILNRLSAITYLSANSRNFKQQWQSIIQTAARDPNNELLIANLRTAISFLTGLDLENDITSWMDGEYAFFMYPARGGLLTYFNPQLYLGLGLMIQTSDRSAAEATLKKLDQVFRTNVGTGALVTRRVNGQPVVSWESKGSRGRSLSMLSHGWVDKDTLVITTGVPAIAPLTPKPYLPLQQNYTFKTATESFPLPNEGYFYVNMGASLSFLYGLILPSVPKPYLPIVQEVQRVVGTIRSVSTSNSATPEAQRIDGLWVLGPVRR